MSLKDKLKQIDNKLQDSANRINNKPHWFIVFLTIAVLIADISALGWYLFITLQPEPPVYIIFARSESTSVKYLGETISYHLDEPYLTRFQLFDLCGDRYILQILYPIIYDKITAYYKDFLRSGQQNVTYSVSIVTDKKEGKVPLHVYSDETSWEIQKQTEAVEIAGESKNIEPTTKKRINVDLSIHNEKHEVLFDIIPAKDRLLNITCVGIKNCHIIKIKYISTRIPLNMHSVSMSNLRISDKILNKNYSIPPPIFENATIYELNYKTEKFEKLSVENPKEAHTFMEFYRPLPCKEDGRIFLKQGY